MLIMFCILYASASTMIHVNATDEEAVLCGVSKSTMYVKILCHGYAQASVFNDHAVSVTQCRSFFLHNQHDSFNRYARDSKMFRFLLVDRWQHLLCKKLHDLIIFISKKFIYFANECKRMFEKAFEKNYFNRLHLSYSNTQILEIPFTYLHLL